MNNSISNIPIINFGRRQYLKRITTYIMKPEDKARIITCVIILVHHVWHERVRFVCVYDKSNTFFSIAINSIMKLYHAWYEQVCLECL